MDTKRQVYVLSINITLLHFISNHTQNMFCFLNPDQSQVEILSNFSLNDTTVFLLRKQRTEFMLSTSPCSEKASLAL